MILEEQILGRFLKDDKIYFQTGSMFTPSFFNDPIDREIFTHYKQSLLEGKGIDVVTITNLTYSPSEALVRVGHLISAIDYSLEVSALLDRAYVKIKKSKIKQFVDGMIDANISNPDKVITQISEFVNTFDTSGYTEIVTMQDNVDNLLKLVEFNKTHTGLTGIDTGFAKLNKITNGLQGGDLIIVAAETSQGKTSFALNMAQVAGQTKPVYLVTCEMMPSQITARMMAYESEVNSNHILTGRLNETETQALHSNAAIVGYNQLIINDKDNSIDKIISNIRILHATKNIEMVVIDYLQLIHTSDRGNKEQQVAAITRRLKNLAKELKIPIILLSQLSRNRDSPFPKMSRLRDSGQIEEAADIVIFIYRPEYYGLTEFHDGSSSDGRAQIIIAKGRNTGIGSFYAKFNKQLTKFTDEYDEVYTGVPF